ncbi:hypothetical protein D9M70_411020 [compost metagenome]
MAGQRVQRRHRAGVHHLAAHRAQARQRRALRHANGAGSNAPEDDVRLRGVPEDQGASIHRGLAGVGQRIACSQRAGALLDQVTGTRHRIGQGPVGGRVQHQFAVIDNRAGAQALGVVQLCNRPSRDAGARRQAGIGALHVQHAASQVQRTRAGQAARRSAAVGDSQRSTVDVQSGARLTIELLDSLRLAVHIRRRAIGDMQHGRAAQRIVGAQAQRARGHGGLAFVVVGRIRQRHRTRAGIDGQVTRAGDLGRHVGRGTGGAGILGQRQRLAGLQVQLLQAVVHVQTIVRRGGQAIVVGALGHHIAALGDVDFTPSGDDVAVLVHQRNGASGTGRARGVHELGPDTGIVLCQQVSRVRRTWRARRVRLRHGDGHRAGAARVQRIDRDHA